MNIFTLGGEICWMPGGGRREDMNESQSKVRGLALDLVEEGKDLSLWEQKVQKRKSLCRRAVTNKMMYSDVIRIAWPSMVELLLTQLASMVDLMMVGQLGAWALTSVGLTTQPKFLFMTIFQAMNVGATAMVARYKGAGRPDKANLVMRQALMMTFLGCDSDVIYRVFYIRVDGSI